MRRRLFGVLIGTALLVPPTFVRLAAQAQTLTIDQILDSYVTAIGGRAAVEKITSLTARGTIDVPDANLSGTVEVFQKAPNKASTRIDLPGAGQQVDGFDGSTAWASDMNGVRVKEGLELVEARRSAMFGREIRLKEIYAKMTVTGREPVAGKDAYVIDAVPSEGTPAKLYFDVASGLLVRQIVTRQSPMGPIEVDVALDDYRVVDGVKRPFRIRQATSMYSAVVQYTDVKSNAPIDDSVFKKPGGL